ncbi:MAG: hypothetical protein ACP5OG_00645 [Candidatus Nanoarchaeia archaeon]
MTNQTQNNKTLEILCVEDNEDFMNDLKSHIQERITNRADIKVDYATNLKDALDYCSQKQYSGIISDVFYESNLENDREIRASLADLLSKKIDNNPNYTPAINSWKNAQTQAPMGVYLAQQTGKIPFVFCTSTHHHGKKTEPVNQYAQSFYNYKTDIIEREVYMVDGNTSTQESEASKKNWSRAYEILIKAIKNRENEEEKTFNELKGGEK